MQSPTIAPILRFSIIAIITFLFSLGLNAQGIVIKEKVTINSQQSTNASVQSWELAPSANFTMPFTAGGILQIWSYDYCFPGDAKLSLNGNVIIEDIWQQVHSGYPNILIGEFSQGQSMTLTLERSDGWPPWHAQICYTQEDRYWGCLYSIGIVFTDTPMCGQIYGQNNTPIPPNVNIRIDFWKSTDEKVLISDMGGYFVWGEPILTRARNASVCWQQGEEPLPEGATFTFTITEGQEHAILYDIYSGNEGTSLSGISKDYGGGWVRLKVIGDEPSQPEYVTVEAQTTVPGLNSCSGRFEIRPRDLIIIPTKSTIVYGDTLKFDVWKRLPDGSLGPLAPGTTVYYAIVEGQDAGFLYSPDSSQVGDGLAGDFSWAKFAALEESPQSNSTKVKVRVVAVEPSEPPPPCPNCPIGKITSTPTISILTLSGRQISETLRSKTFSVSSQQTKLAELRGNILSKDSLARLMKKNPDGSYSFGNRNQKGSGTEPKSVDSVQQTIVKNPDGSYSILTGNQTRSQTKSSAVGLQSVTSGDPLSGFLVGMLKIDISKPLEILLGETKYYRAKLDPNDYDNLIIIESESSDPELGEGDSRVIFEDPVIADDAINNDKVGVYWDYLKPDGTGLDDGVIRLIGRYWKQDTTYKIKLHAVLPEDGRTASIEIEVKKSCIQVQYASLSIGDTTLLSFVYTSTGSPVPADISLDVSVGGTGGESGILLVNGSTGTNFTGVTQPIEYIAPAEITEDELDVPIVAVESDGLSASIQGNNTHQSAGPSLSKTSTMSPRIVATLKAQGTGASCLPRSVKVLAPVKLVLEIDKKTLNHNETTPLRSILYDKNNDPINKFNANVQFELGAESDGYGVLSFLSQGMILSVPYSYASSGFVSCIAKGQEWENRFPLVARISASGMFGGKYLKDLKPIIIKGSNTIGEIFYQNDLLWAAQQYDEYIDTARTRITGNTVYYNIGDKGCALSCMAMVLSAYGVQIDPGKLATWMDNEGYWGEGGDVKWDPVTDYNNPSKLKAFETIGDGIKSGKTIDMSIVDDYLSQGKPIIAQVSNNGNNHWVVITGKSGNDYNILDPGSKNNIKTSLRYSYGNNVFKMVVYTP